MKHLWLIVLLGSFGCAENKAASAACKGETDSETCQKCCTGKGANGYKYLNGSCGCLGGE